MTTSTASRSRPSAARIALWVLQGLLALMFVAASGVPKLLGDAYAVALFTDIGVGQWLRYVVGVLEVLGGIGLLVPRLAGRAALGLVVVMVGATFSQLFLLDEGFWFTPVILGVLLAVVAYCRRDEFRAVLRP